MPRSVNLECRKCKDTLNLQIDLEEFRKKSKGGVYKVMVPHSGHSTIFFLSLTKNHIQLWNQVIGESIANTIVATSQQQISLEKAKNIDLLLTNFMGIAPAVELVCVLDQSRNSLGTKPAPDLSEIQINRYEALIQQILNHFEHLSFGTDVFEVGELRLVLTKAGPEFILVCISNLNSPTEQTLAYCYLTAEKLWRLMDDRSVTLDIPILAVEKSSAVKPEDDQIRHLGIKPDQYLAKLTIVGDETVGKTSIIRRFVDNTFKMPFWRLPPYLQSPIHVKTVRFPDEKTTMILNIHDMGSQNQFASVRKIYFRGTHACFIVFDVTNRESFHNVKNWYDQTIQYAGEHTAIILLGNKVDQPDHRVVRYEEAAELIQELGCMYLETSAKTGENVEMAFSLIALFLCDRTEEYDKFTSTEWECI